MASDPAMRASSFLALMPAAALLLLVGCNDPSQLGDGFTNNPNHRQEYFTQLEPSQADILWVIDSSCSMSDEQDSLVQNFPYFIEFFLTRGLAFRLAVTTTNVADPNSEGLDGALNGDPPWITEATPDLEPAFLERALVGIDEGHGKEKGLEAAYLAIAEPHDGDEGFVRDDAQLAIVLVSDEPDHTERLNEPDYDQYINWEDFSAWLNALKGPQMERMSQLSAIVGIGPDGFDDPNGCGNQAEQGQGAARGDGYLEAAAATGGTWVSICTADWGDMMARVGLAAAGLMDAWPLEEEPEPGSLEVEVDGRSVSGWVHREWDNSVHFVRANAIPLPGEQVAVTYTVASVD